MPTSSTAGELLREVARIYVRAQRTQAACRDGASTVQCHVITELLRQERLSQQTLVTQLDLDKGWISRAVEALVADGTILKSPNIDDRRSAWLSLSPAGLMRARKLNAQLNAHADEVLAKVPATQHGVIRESLALLLQSLQGGGNVDVPPGSEGVCYAADLPLEVREANESDWPAIAALLGSVGLPLAGAEANLAQYRIASQGKNLLAIGGLEIYGHGALLRSLAVTTSAHGRGLGLQMLEALIAEAADAGIDKLYLLTDGADGYFARFGFSVIPRKAVPAAIRRSAVFQGACPASAVAMVRTL